LTALHAIPRGLHPPIIDAESWSAVPLLAIPAMAYLLWMGWRNRMDPQAHKRFMLVYTLCMVEPGLGRWPLFPPNMAGPCHQQPPRLCLHHPADPVGQEDDRAACTGPPRRLGCARLWLLRALHRLGLGHLAR
jgi:hypothetical protein